MSKCYLRCVATKSYVNLLIRFSESRVNKMIEIEEAFHHACALFTLH